MLETKRQGSTRILREKIMVKEVKFQNLGQVLGKKAEMNIQLENVFKVGKMVQSCSDLLDL